MSDKIEHLERLTLCFFANIEQHHDGEYGSIGLDSKRPFGNSDVEGDILEIIDAKMEGDDGEDACWSSKQREHAAGFYDELPTFLQQKYLTAIPKRFAYKFNNRPFFADPRFVK